MDLVGALLDSLLTSGRAYRPIADRPLENSSKRAPL